MDRQRLQLEEVLRETLPGFGGQNSEGTWGFASFASQPAAVWKLEPSGPGFWLILEGQDRPECPEPLASFPVKWARHGQKLFWRAELYLQGIPGDRDRVQGLLEQLRHWLGEAKSIPSAKEAFSPPDDWPQHIARLFGEKLAPAGSNYRLANAAGPAIELSAAGDGLRIHCRLLRLEEEPILDVLDDLLTVANGRMHGCRAFFQANETGKEVRLESRMSWDGFSSNVLRALVADFRSGVTPLACACQALAEMPEAAQAYRQYLLGPQNDQAPVSR